MSFGTDLFFLVFSVENRRDYDKIPAENKQKVSCVQQHHERKWAGNLIGYGCGTKLSIL